MKWLRDSWAWFLITLGLRPDIRKPEYAAPAWEDEPPHAYASDATDSANCCLRCGGGRLHSIHRV